jgi:2-oxoglutarate/2-oxoacid ferredoxin oxidoreductase subunit beta
LVFGENMELGIKLDGFKPTIVNLADVSANDLWIHDETDLVKATILSRFYDDPSKEGHFPRPFGVFYVNNNKTPFDVLFNNQINHAIENYGAGDLDKLLTGRETWVVN